MPTVGNALVRGHPLRSAEREIIPVARATRLTWPGGRLEWHRPVAVEVRFGDSVQRIPIRNWTRLAVLMSLGVCLTLGGVTAYWASRERPPRRIAR
jgi:hypothetical protein